MPISYEIKKSPCGKYYVCVGGSINVFDQKTGIKLISFKELKHPDVISFSKKGDLLGVKNTSGKIAIYNLNDMSCLNIIFPTKKEGANLLFTHDDKNIVSADWAGNIYTIDIKENTSEIIKHEQARFTAIEYIEEKDEYIFQSELYCISWKYPFSNNKPKILENNVKNENKDRNSEIFYKKKFCKANGYNLVCYRYENYIDVYDERDSLIKRIYTNDVIDKISFDWSVDGKYIGIISGNTSESMAVRIVRFTDEKVIKDYKFEFPCYVEFTQDGKELLIGTWKNGYVIDINDLEEESDKHPIVQNTKPDQSLVNRKIDAEAELKKALESLENHVVNMTKKLIDK